MLNVRAQGQLLLQGSRRGHVLQQVQPEQLLADLLRQIDAVQKVDIGNGEVPASHVGCKQAALCQGGEPLDQIATRLGLEVGRRRSATKDHFRVTHARRQLDVQLDLLGDGPYLSACESAGGQQWPVR